MEGMGARTQLGGRRLNPDEGFARSLRNQFESLNGASRLHLLRGSANKGPRNVLVEVCFAAAPAPRLGVVHH